jgi:hypothetical protein
MVVVVSENIAHSLCGCSWSRFDPGIKLCLLGGLLKEVYHSFVRVTTCVQWLTANHALWHVCTTNHRPMNCVSNTSFVRA